MSEPAPPYVIDLHAHFPMQLDPESQDFRRQIRKPRFEQSCALIAEQIDRLIAWGGESLPAIGSDLDGFIVSVQQSAFSGQLRTSFGNLQPRGVGRR